MTEKEPQGNGVGQGSFARFLASIKGRCQFLLLSLVTLLLIYHRAAARPFLALIINAGILATGVYAVSDSNKYLLTAVAIGILQVFIAVVDLSAPSLGLTIAAYSLLVVFYAFTLIRVLEYVVRGREVTRDKIYGAVSVYLLIGFTWAYLYRLVFIYQPDAFSFPAKQSPDFVYFSFSTLCTVGYGDITPVSGFARSLVILEAVTGILYIAVLVSRLVNLYHADSNQG